jgi:hypothetical protein
MDTKPSTKEPETKYEPQIGVVERCLPCEADSGRHHRRFLCGRDAEHRSKWVRVEIVFFYHGSSDGCRSVTAGVPTARPRKRDSAPRLALTPLARLSTLPSKRIHTRRACSNGFGESPGAEAEDFLAAVAGFFASNGFRS